MRPITNVARTHTIPSMQDLSIAPFLPQRESPRIHQLRNTCPSSSYLTLASGEYIMRMRPMAIGTDVVPSSKTLIKSAT